MCGTHTTTPRWLHGTRHTEVLRVCSVCCGGFLTHRQSYNIFYRLRFISLHTHTYDTCFSNYPPHVLYMTPPTCIQVDTVRQRKCIYFTHTLFDINLVKMFFSFLQRNFRHEEYSNCKCFSVYLLVYK